MEGKFHIIIVKMLKLNVVKNGMVQQRPSLARTGRSEVKRGEDECGDRNHPGCRGQGWPSDTVGEAFLSLKFHSQSLGVARYKALSCRRAPARPGPARPSRVPSARAGARGVGPGAGAGRALSPPPWHASDVGPRRPRTSVRATSAPPCPLHASRGPDDLEATQSRTRSSGPSGLHVA